jgi:hypothetical protein
MLYKIDMYYRFSLWFFLIYINVNIFKFNDKKVIYVQY